MSNNAEDSSFIFDLREMEFSADINTLSSLLAESREAEGQNSVKSNQPPKITESTVVRKVTDNKDILKSAKISDTTKAIWNETEIVSEESFVDFSDKRPCPRYEFCYKQTVGTEDTFLGMSDKTPLTSDCSHLVVKVHFPGYSLKDIDLKVTSQRINANTRSLKLQTYLPVKVDDTNGKATFDPKKEVLTVTLPIIHEF